MSGIFRSKYYYLTLDKDITFYGQDSAAFQDSKTDFQIRRGCSIVALQLTEDSSSSASPWRLLVLSCNSQASDSLPALKSGFEAYLWGIGRELTAARRSLRDAAEQISLIATPSVSSVSSIRSCPDIAIRLVYRYKSTTNTSIIGTEQDDFTFNSNSRESLLFENSTYTNSRTYFWALQSLRIINDNIRSLTKVWTLHDNSEIVPQDGTIGESAERIKGSVAQINCQMEQFQDMIKTNNTSEEEIQALPDGVTSMFFSSLPT